MDNDKKRVLEARCPICGAVLQIVKEVPSGTMGTKTAYIARCGWLRITTSHYWLIDFDGDGRMIIEERLDCDLKLLGVPT